MSRTQGMVYLVGAGPGDDKLITRRALDCLFMCDTVVYDYLASEYLLREVGAECEKIYVGKRAGLHSKPQEEINQILIAQANAGKCVVRLKGGDPMVFGRGGEEVLALQEAGIPYQVVPGVTSAVAALSSAGIPITHRGISRSFHVMTGHIMGRDGSLPKDFEHFARLEGTLVFLMGLNNIDKIVHGLLECGTSEDTPAAVIENGTMPKQRVVRASLKTLIAEVKVAQIHSPAIIVVGGVAAYHMESTVQSPLQGITVGLSGTESFVKKLSASLEAEGAQTEWLLRLETIVPDNPELETAFSNLNGYTWLVFTSANGVRLFFQKLLNMGYDYRILGHLKFAVIGQGTGKVLLSYGFLADYVPEEFSSYALGMGLAERLMKDDRVLIPRAAKGSKQLTKVLEANEIRYHDVILYDIKHACEHRERLKAQLNNCQYITFGSGSGVDALAEQLSFEDLKDKGMKIACIGDITAERLVFHGFSSHITADECSTKGLVQAIIKDVHTNSNK